MTTVDENTLKQILDIEWEMFHTVEGIDGPAICQQDRGTFELMRSSQIRSWSEEVAESYLVDLEGAQVRGRNLMSEKYARMMQYTSPCEYRRIEAKVPLLDQQAVPVVERLSGLLVRWQEELAAKYPFLAGQGRPIRSCDDNKYTPSFETYNRGELSTYSPRTLELLEKHYLAMAEQGESPAEVILKNTVEQYGYASLERAEAVQRARVEQG